MTVSIDIDLDAMDAIQEIATLRAAMESLDDDLDLDFEIDGDGDLGKKLDELGDSMGNLSDNITKDLDNTIDRLENVQLDDVQVVGGGNGDSGGDTGSDSGDKSIRQKLTEINNGRNDLEGVDQVARRFGPGSRIAMEEQNRKRSLGKMIKEASDMAGIRSEMADMRSPNYTGDYDFESGFGRDNRVDASTGGLFDWIEDAMSVKEFKGRAGLDPNKPFPENRDTFSRAQGPGERGAVGFPSIGRGGRMGKNKNSLLGGMVKSALGMLDGAGDSIKNMKKSFKKLIPSMSTWINLVGAAVPALGAMAVQALGVASAMGAMALAGGAVIGLGLLGHGDSMAESMKNAKEQVADLKKELFAVMEPAADAFSQTQAEFFDFIPGQLDRVQKSMQGLLTFEDDFFQLFTGLTEFVAEFIDVIVENDDKISGLTDTFSKIVGSSIIDLFDWLLEVGWKNQDMLITLGTVLKTFGETLFNVFMIVGRAVTMLSGLFSIFSFLSNLLNNTLVSGMVAVVAVIYMIVSATTFLIGALGSVATILGTGLIPLFSSMFTMLSSYIFQSIAATVASYGLAAGIANVAAALGTLLAMSGIGLLIGGAGLAIGGAMGMPGPGGNGSGAGGQGRGGNGRATNQNGGNDVTVNIGNTDNSTIEKFADLGGGTRGSVGGSYTS